MNEYMKNKLEFDAELVEEERLIQTNQVDVMIEMAKDSDKLESENFIEKAALKNNNEE